jgi:TRAP-type C4-dicarboxylate transport system permease small subunit
VAAPGGAICGAPIARQCTPFGHPDSLMDYFIRTVTSMSRAAGVIGALLIGLAVFVICDMVIERYVLNLTTIWQIDVVTYCIVGATFIGSSYVLMTRGHVNVDILPLHAGPRARYWLALATGLLAFAFCVAIFVLCTMYWYAAFTENWLSNTVWRARLWIPYLSMPIGLGLVVLQYLVELLSLVTGRSPPFGISEKQGAADVILAQAHEALGDAP